MSKKSQVFEARSKLDVLKPTAEAIHNVLIAIVNNVEDVNWQKDKRRAFDGIMLNQAVTSSVLWRDQLQTTNRVPARGHRTHDFRSATLHAAVNESEGSKVVQATKARQTSVTTTSHPNGNLTIKIEGALMDFAERFNNLTIEQKQKLLELGEKLRTGDTTESVEKFDFIPGLVDSVGVAIKEFLVPQKQTMDDAMERGMMFNRRAAERAPAYFANAIGANRMIGDDTSTFVEAKELRAIGRPIQLLTWYDADGDGNPYVVPQVTEKGIKRAQEVARDAFYDALDRVYRDVNLGSNAKDVKDNIREIRDSLKSSSLPLDIFSENGLLEKLYKLKENIEGERGIHLSRIRIDGVDSVLTTLDASIALVQNTGEVIAMKEERQNAETIRAAMDVLTKRLVEAKLLSEDEGRDRAKIFEILIKNEARSNELRMFVQQELATFKTIPDDSKPNGELADYYKILSFMELSNKNPNAIHSMVIAETGALKEEDLPGESKAFMMRNLTSGKGLNDLVSAHVMLEITAPKHGQQQAIHLRGLFEGRLPVENIPVMLLSFLDKSPALRERYMELQELTVMFAQSDTSREHGIMSILSVFESAEQLRKLAKDLAEDMVTEFFPKLEGEARQDMVDRFELFIKLGAGAALSRGFPPSLLYSDDTTLQGGSMTFISQIIHKLVEWMTSTKAVHEMGHRLTHDEAERISRFGYTGDILLMDENLSPKVKDYIDELGIKGCTPYERFMDDPRAHAWFDHSPYSSIVGPNNKGPRPNQKKKAGGEEIFPPHNDIHKARAIGYGLAQYVEGTNPIFTLGLEEFFKLDDDGKMWKGHRDKVISVLNESARHNEMVSRAELGILLSDFDKAWKAHGYERRRDKDHDIIIVRTDEKGEEHSVKLRELYEAYKEPYNHNPQNPEALMEYKGFRADAIALGFADMTNERVARAIYEVRFEQRKAYAKREGVKPGAPVIQFITEDQFTPEHLSTVLSPVFEEQYKLIKGTLDDAREELAKENARWLKEGKNWTDEQKKAFADKNYYNYIAVEQAAEGGAALSLALAQQQLVHDNWRTKDHGKSVVSV